MIPKRRLLVNALASVVQVVVTGGSFVVLYRFVKDTIGIEQFGVWALVLATTAAGHVANLGLASGTIKYVAMYRAREQEDRVVQVVETAALALAVFLALVLPLLYPIFLRIIAATVEPGLFDAAQAVLPYALTSFWISAVAGVFQAGLDGCQRIDQRGGLLAVSALAYLGFAFWFVPQRGLVGLAQAQVLQAGMLLAGSWGLVKRLIPGLPLVPYRWDRATFKEMLGYSLNFQVISTAQLLFEPLTKILVMNFGGAAATGYFEFAHRMVFQLRALVVTAHQAVVPTIADLHERAPALLRDVYVASYRLLLFLILLSLPLCVVLTPWISRLWIGAYEPDFVLFADLLFAGWFLNMLSNPAYFAYQGIGRLRWNVAGHLVIGALNVGLGVLLGWRYGGTGVVAGFVTALLTGSLVIIVAYHREYGIRTVDLVRRESVLLAGATLAGLALAAAVTARLPEGTGLVARGLLPAGIYLAVVAVPCWLHSARRQLQAWLVHAFVRASPEPSDPP